MITIDLEKTIKKMMRIVRGDTGGSRVYADMLLSIIPNSTYKVNMSQWCYKADVDDFKVMLKLIKIYKMPNDEIIWEYDKLITPYRDELIAFVEKKELSDARYS